MRLEERLIGAPRPVRRADQSPVNYRCTSVRHPDVAEWDHGVVSGFRRIGVFVLVLASIGTACSDDDEAVFCHADGFISESGETYVRSPDHDCRFVDANGDLLTEVDGRRLCYSEEQSPVTLDC